MQAARVLDLPSFSLAYLLDSYCAETADKQHQLADWRVYIILYYIILYYIILYYIILCYVISSSCTFPYSFSSTSSSARSLSRSLHRWMSSSPPRHAHAAIHHRAHIEIDIDHNTFTIRLWSNIVSGAIPADGAA
jgi:hypothetical protein